MQNKKFYDLPGLQHEADRFRKLLDISKDDDHILIRGPRGAGKSYFFQVFLNHKKIILGEKDEPVNCAAIHPGSVVSELFGHKRGSFTGANTARAGYIKTAGEKYPPILFLEELNSLERAHQAKLLVFMEKNSFYPLGSDVPEKANVRIIATMNDEEGDDKSRQDLLDRFKIIVTVPPLYERREDIFTFIAEEYPHLLMDKVELLSLYAHNWPGNIRELDRVLLDMKAGVGLRKDILANGANGQYYIQKSMVSSGLPEERIVELGRESFQQIIPWGTDDLHLSFVSDCNRLEAFDKIFLEKKINDDYSEITINFKQVDGNSYPIQSDFFTVYFRLIGNDHCDINLFHQTKDDHLFFLDEGDLANLSLAYGLDDNEEKRRFIQALFGKANKSVGQNKGTPPTILPEQVINFILELGPFTEVERFLYTEGQKVMGTQKALAKHWDMPVSTLGGRIRGVRKPRPDK